MEGLFLRGQDLFTGHVLKNAGIGGCLWEGARFLLAELPAARGAVRRILPPGLLPSRPPALTVFIAEYPRTAFTVPYREAAVLVHVRTLLGEGVHCCWMVVDDDTALIYGRELLGYPKKLAAIGFEESGEGISAFVERRGVRVLEMRGRKGEVQAGPPPVFGRKTFNVGGVGQAFAVSPLWLLRPREVIHESYQAEVEVAVRPSGHDPIAELAAGEPRSGRIAVTDIPGTDYLLPVGVAGPFWLNRAFALRFR